MKDFSLKVTVRNARLLHAILEKWPSAAAFARDIRLTNTAVNGFICMRRLPVDIHGEWTDKARDIAAALGKYPDELWPEHLRELKAKRATTEVLVDKDEMVALSEPNTFEARRLIAKWSENVSPRHARALALFAGGCTFKDVGDELGVSAARARQIIVVAQRKMKTAAKRDRIEHVNDIL